MVYYTTPGQNAAVRPKLLTCTQKTGSVDVELIFVCASAKGETDAPSAIGIGRRRPEPT